MATHNGPIKNCKCRRLGAQNRHPYKRPITWFDHDLRIIDENLKRKYVRGVAQRNTTIEEPYFPEGGDFYIPEPIPGTIPVVLGSRTEVQSLGIVASGSSSNFPTFDGTEFFFEGSGTCRVDADNQGLHAKNVWKNMNPIAGSASVWLYPHDTSGSGTINTVFDIGRNLTVRYESGSSQLRMYPDLANDPTTFMYVDASDWWTQAWKKLEVAWDYGSQAWTMTWGGTDATQSGSGEIKYPNWNEFTYISIFTDLDNANNVYHDCAFLDIGVAPSRKAMGRFEAMREPTGFPNRTDTTIAFSDSSPDRTFTISPVGSSFTYYIHGAKFTKYSSETVQLTDTDGLWLIYYVGDTLTALHDPTIGEWSTAISDYTLVAVVYWNATQSEGALFDERHGITMDSMTHSYLHFTRGTAYGTGLALGDFVIDDGDDNEDAQFSNTSGAVWDEDIRIIIAAVAKTVGLEIWYIDTGVWRWTTNAGYSILNAVAGRMQYNTGGALVEVTDNRYALCHVFATNHTDGKLTSIVGQNQYLTLSAAQDGAESEISTLVLGDLPSEEMKPIATVIFHTKNTFGNAVKSRIEQTAAGANYIDWRANPISAGIPGPDHGALGGLNDDDHFQYTLLNIDPTNAPTVNDDIDDGWRVGTIWIKSDTDAIYMSTDDTVGAANWELLNAASASADVGGFFGTGSDGNVTINAGGTVTLTRDMFYENLTVTNNTTLDVAGYKIFVRDTLTIDSGSKISRNGTAGNNGGNGGHAIGNLPGLGGASGGAVAGLADGSIVGNGLNFSQPGQAGGAGAVPLGIGVAGTDATSGYGVTNSYFSLIGLIQGNLGGAGGAGLAGAGGAGGGAGLGTGGTEVKVPANSGGVENIFSLTHWRSFPIAALPLLITARGGMGDGAGGGGGGGGFAGAGGGGGAGGSAAIPGGGVYIAARHIISAGSIDSVGGAGGTGGTGGNGATDGGGGGGGAGGDGGRGGLIVLVYGDTAGAGTISVLGGALGTGGAGGAGAGGAGNGIAGNNGDAGNTGVLVEFAIST